MKNTKQFQYSLEYFYPKADRQKFWDMFVDHEAWSESKDLPGVIRIDKPGKNHPQGLGATRSVITGPMTITEDIVAFQPPEYFRYETRNGSMPVNDFGGELRFVAQQDGVLAIYHGGFNAKYRGTGWLFKRLLRLAQHSAFKALESAYGQYYKNH